MRVRQRDELAQRQERQQAEEHERTGATHGERDREDAAHDPPGLDPRDQVVHGRARASRSAPASSARRR